MIRVLGLQMSLCSASAFENFEERLRFWQKLHAAPPAPTQPILRRADRTTEN
jgi:hypothetical protein